MSKVNKTKVECPKCGAEFAIPAHETVAIGIVIGQDSNLGTVHPPLAENEPKPRSATKPVPETASNLLPETAK